MSRYSFGMCERYAVPEQALAERALAPQRKWWKFSASFNVAPWRYVPAVRLHERESEAVMLRWGLVPAWAKGDASAGQWLRLSCGALDGSALFRGPWLAGQRCILPFAGFYTWRLTGAGYRQPYFVQVRDRPVFAVAALWDRTEDDDGDVTEGCAILTVPASAPLAMVQTASREMPAILGVQDCEAWLHGTPAQARELLMTRSAVPLTSHPVSPRINSLACDDAGLARAVG
jgi:putative SOS response-associated peptidase YedK